MNVRMGIVAFTAAAAALVTLQDARAVALAYSVNEIFNLRVSPGIGGNLTFAQGSPAFESFDRANLASVQGEMSNTDNTGPTFDALLACEGDCGRLVNNDFREHLPHLAQGDAVIDNTGVLAGTFRARNDALVHLDRPDRGSAGASNTVTADFALAMADAITFTFDARPALNALLSRDLMGSTGAELRFVIRIRDGGGALVFEWAPNGMVDRMITGGTEMTDDTSLNLVRGADRPGDSSKFNPAGVLEGMLDDADCAVVPPAPIGTCNYAAVTNNLAMGSYRLTIAMTELASTSDIRARVPEPNGLGLFVLGLMGLVLGRIPRGRHGSVHPRCPSKNENLRCRHNPVA
ncbi:MAG: hypothetical protein M3Z21_05535 [Pseudomonadota bacterium]|nr:hypothetical protein [Pseudomonadota bacterium]